MARRVSTRIWRAASLQGYGTPRLYKDMARRVSTKIFMTMTLKKRLIAILCLIPVSILLLWTIYYVSKDHHVWGSLLFVFNVYLWLKLTPLRIHHGDAAGDGMSDGFDSLINIGKAIGLGIVYYLLLTFVESDRVLPICLSLLSLYFVKRLIWRGSK